MGLIFYRDEIYLTVPKGKRILGKTALHCTLREFKEEAKLSISDPTTEYMDTSFLTRLNLSTNNSPRWYLKFHFNPRETGHPYVLCFLCDANKSEIDD